MKKLLIALLATSSALSVAPANAASVDIQGSYTAPVACTIEPPAAFTLTDNGESIEGGTFTEFSQTGNTFWSLSEFEATASGDTATGLVPTAGVVFPNGESLGGVSPFPFTFASTVVQGAQSGLLNISGGLASDRPLVGGATYTISATLTCIAE